MNRAFDRCTKCILSASFPKIEFDNDGVCNFCLDKMFHTSEQKNIDKSKQKIDGLIESSKGTSEYDGIMCYSGGKDSTYSLMLAVKKYDLKILSFTLDNGFISRTAFENINRVVDLLGVDQITVRPSSKFIKSVIKYSSLNNIYNPKTLVRISAGCNSCISLVNIMALKFALEKEVPFIFAGFTLGQIPSNAILYKNNYSFFQESRESSLEKLRKYMGGQIDEYYCIKPSIINRVKSYPYNINLLCIENISEQEIVKHIKPLGWQKPGDVDGCSSNCRLNTFNNYVHQKNFGYSPYELELSHLIRKKQLTRDEALKKINDQPVDQLQAIMNELGISEKDINELTAT